jgi:hypothetical protein
MGASNPTKITSSNKNPLKYKLTYAFEAGIWNLYNREEKTTTVLHSFNLALASNNLESFVTGKPKEFEVWSNWVERGKPHLLTINVKDVMNKKRLESFKGQLGDLAKQFVKQYGGKSARNYVGLLTATAMKDGALVTVVSSESCYLEITGMSYNSMQKSYENEDSDYKSEFKAAEAWLEGKYPVFRYNKKNVNYPITEPGKTPFGNKGSLFIGEIVEGNNPETFSKIVQLDEVMLKFLEGSPNPEGDVHMAHSPLPEGATAIAAEASDEDDLPF